ncbi:MAG: hypothetical protein V9E94_03975 [Microthrixaceae bacterium]
MSSKHPHRPNILWRLFVVAGVGTAGAVTVSDEAWEQLKNVAGDAVHARRSVPCSSAPRRSTRPRARLPTARLDVPASSDRAAGLGQRCCGGSRCCFACAGPSTRS